MIARGGSDAIGATGALGSELVQVMRARYALTRIEYRGHRAPSGFLRRVWYPAYEPAVAFNPSVRAQLLRHLSQQRCGNGAEPRSIAASIVAIFAVRITDGAGSPAAARSRIGTSPDQIRFSALVIMLTHSSPCASSMPLVDTTTAGRDCRRV